VRTATGFSVQLLNYSPGLDYSFAATNGALVTDLGATLIVWVSRPVRRPTSP